MASKAEIDASVCSIFWAWANNDISLSDMMVKLRKVKNIIERGGVEEGKT